MSPKIENCSRIMFICCSSDLQIIEENLDSTNLSGATVNQEDLMTSSSEPPGRTHMERLGKPTASQALVHDHRLLAGLRTKSNRSIRDSSEADISL